MKNQLKEIGTPPAAPEITFTVGHQSKMSLQPHKRVIKK